MAGSVFYLLPSLAGATQFLATQQDGAAPANAKFSPVTGWATANPAARCVSGESNNMDSQVVPGPGTWTSDTGTPKPVAPTNTTGNGWRTPNPLTGRLLVEAYSFSFAVQSDLRITDGRFCLDIRIYRSVNADGSAATEVTSGDVSTASTTANLSLTVPETITGTWTPAAVLDLNNEYLFFAIAVRCTTTPTQPGATPSKDIVFAQGAASAITIPSFMVVKGTPLVVAARSRQVIAPIKTITKNPIVAPRRRSLPPIIKTTERKVGPISRRRAIALLSRSVNKVVVAPRSRQAVTSQWYTAFQDIAITRSYSIPPIIKTITKKIDLLTWARQIILLGSADKYERLNLGAYLAGKMGDIEPHPRLYLSNIYGEEISLLRTVRSAAISLNNGRDHLFEMTLGMRATDQFNPLADFIKPVIDYWNPIEQTYERWPLGVYRVMLPNQSISESSRFWDFTASSYENIVAQDMADKGYAVLPNTKILAKVRAILMVEFAVPPSMLDFPPDVEDLPVLGYRIFDVRDDTDGCYWLNIINTMLSMGGYTKLQATSEGKLRTRKISNPIARPPDYILGIGGDNIIDARDAVKSDVDQSEFANVVLVTSNDTLLPPIVARSENHNPNSPSSIENMGNVSIVKHIQLPEFVNATAAKAIADAELARRSGLNEKLSYNTPVDPRRAVPNEVGEINLFHSDGKVAVEGRWLVGGWNFSVEPLVSKMENNLTRLAQI